MNLAQQWLRRQAFDVSQHLRQRAGRQLLRVVLQPLVGAQRVHHVHHRQRAVFERDAGVLGLRTFFIRGQPHQALQGRRRGAAVVEAGDSVAPPGTGALERRSIIATGEDALTHARRAQPGVQVDPAERRAARLHIQTHQFADAQAAITWSSGVSTSIKTDVNLKTLIGRGSGESIQMAFTGQGWVLVQPSEGQISSASPSGGGGGMFGNVLGG